MASTRTKITGILGIGIAAGCTLWVLMHLVLFYTTGYVMIGEDNKSLLLVEISIICGGLFCFIHDFLSRLQ